MKNSLFNPCLKWYKEISAAAKEDFKGPVLVLQYEQLQNVLSKHLKRIATFLDANVTTHDIICTEKLQEGLYHRNLAATAHDKLVHVVFSETELAAIDRIKADVREIHIKGDD